MQPLGPGAYRFRRTQSIVADFQQNRLQATRIAVHGDGGVLRRVYGVWLVAGDLQALPAQAVGMRSA